MRIDMTVGGGKYRVIQEEDGRLHAQRHGEPWRDLAGDGLILALAQEVERLRKAEGAFAVLEDKTQLHQRIEVVYVVTGWEVTHYTTDGAREVASTEKPRLLDALVDFGEGGQRVRHPRPLTGGVYGLEEIRAVPPEVPTREGADPVGRG